MTDTPYGKPSMKFVTSRLNHLSEMLVNDVRVARSPLEVTDYVSDELKLIANMLSKWYIDRMDSCG